VSENAQDFATPTTTLRAEPLPETMTKRRTEESGDGECHLFNSPLESQAGAKRRRQSSNPGLELEHVDLTIEWPAGRPLLQHRLGAIRRIRPACAELSTRVCSHTGHAGSSAAAGAIISRH
jgi:hypothetical protein